MPILNSLTSMLCALVVSATAGQQAQNPPPSPQAPEQQVSATDDRTPVALVDLVEVALRQNLTLRSERIQADIVAAGVQAARSTFDPFFELKPNYTNGSGEVFTTQSVEPNPVPPPTVVVTQPRLLTGSQDTTALSTTLSGTLPFSTQYSASLSTNLLSQFGLPSDDATLSLAVTQPLLKGRGSDIAGAGVRRARFSSEAQFQTFRRQVNLIVADVETAYWNLGSVEAVEQVAISSLQRSREVLSRNQRLRQLELVADVDVITAQRAVATRETQLTEATLRRRNAAETLIFLVFGEGAADQLVARGLRIRTELPPDEIPDMPTIENLENLALGSRHDVKAAQLDLLGVQVSERVARNARLPELNLVGSYSALTTGTNGLHLFGAGTAGATQFSGFGAAVTLTYDIRNNAAEAAWAQALLDVRQQRVTISSVENAIRSEVRLAARTIVETSQKLRQAQNALDLANQQYGAGQQQLQLGLIDSFRLLQMEDDVASASVVAVQTRYDLRLAITAYDLSAGSLDEKYLPATTNPGR